MSVAFKELDFNYPNANKLIDAISNLEKENNKLEKWHREIALKQEVVKEIVKDK